MIGVDYAWPPHPTVSALKGAGVKFVIRYKSTDPNKDLTPAEAKALLAGGIDVGLVYETTADWMLFAGEAGGHAAAIAADELAKACGIPGVIVYFGADFDVQPTQMAAIDACLKGAASAIGFHRVGIYGGFPVVSHCFDHGSAKFGWQTPAWSNGQWDARANIRQLGSFTLDGASCDHDVAMKADFGQFPRPATTAPYRHFTDGTDSLGDIAQKRGTTVTELLGVSAAEYTAADIGDLTPVTLPAGLPYYTKNP